MGNLKGSPRLAQERWVDKRETEGILSDWPEQLIRSELLQVINCFFSSVQQQKVDYDDCPCGDSVDVGVNDVRLASLTGAAEELNESGNIEFHIENSSFTDNFYQHPFAPAPVKFTVKNPFPGAEIESAVRYGNDNFAAHNLSFHMGVGVIFTDIVAVA